MSNILKINKTGNTTVKIRGVDSSSYIGNENAEDQMQLQIHNAREKGFSDGYKKAINELEQKYQANLEKRYEELGTIMMSLENTLADYDNSVNEVICELAFVIAEKIIRESIERNPTINKTLNESMKKVLGANNVIIKLNEKDLNHLNNENKSLLNDAAFSKIKFEADDTIEAGGCLIETDIGNVDARVGTQLKELKKILDNKTINNGSEDVV
jgi:flagellar assembly protein FliH